MQRWPRSPEPDLGSTIFNRDLRLDSSILKVERLFNKQTVANGGVKNLSVKSMMCTCYIENILPDIYSHKMPKREGVAAITDIKVPRKQAW